MEIARTNSILGIVQFTTVQTVKSYISALEDIIRHVCSYLKHKHKLAISGLECNAKLKFSM